MHVSVKSLAPGQVYTRGRWEKGRKREEDSAMQSHRLSIVVCTHGRNTTTTSARVKVYPDSRFSLARGHAIHHKRRYNFPRMRLRASFYAGCSCFYASSSLNRRPDAFEINSEHRRQNNFENYALYICDFVIFYSLNIFIT